VEHWDEWQRAYRFGVILIFPPQPLRAQVNALRARHDPESQATCDAHISLTVPLPREPADRDWEELAAVVAAITPPTIRYGPATTSLPHAGVVLAIEPQAELDRLRAALESCAAFAGATPRRYPFWAHMTIAEFITVERSIALAAELIDVAPSGSFRCDAVSHAVPNADFHFEERLRLPMRGDGRGREVG
jgi:2'-5' RNA ligase